MLIITDIYKNELIEILESCEDLERKDISQIYINYLHSKKIIKLI